MKTFTILTILALTATGSFAADRCNPAKGNWVNAATITCPPNGSFEHDQIEPRDKCEYHKG